MRRPPASDVSALSGFVANGRQAVHPVSFSPSEIPYGGFSPVRLQTGSTRRHLRRLTTYRRPVALSAPALLAPKGNRRTESACRQVPAGRSGPEALGSASGYVVPSPHRLLWPHPSLWASPGGLWFSPPGLCLAAEDQRVPALSCVSVFPCRLPCPGGPGGLRLLYFRPWQPSPICDGLGVRGVPLETVHVAGFSRLQSSLDAAARKLACPTPSRAFTFELSFHESPRWNVEHNYAANQPIAAAGLAPARHTTVQAATRTSR